MRWRSPVLSLEVSKGGVLSQGISAIQKTMSGALWTGPGLGQLGGDGIGDLATATIIAWCTARQDKGGQRQKSEDDPHMIGSGIPV